MCLVAHPPGAGASTTKVRSLEVTVSPRLRARAISTFSSGLRTFTTSDAPSQSFVLGSGVSSSNGVVGNYQDANYVTHGFLHPSSD